MARALHLRSGESRPILEARTGLSNRVARHSHFLVLNYAELVSRDSGVECSAVGR